MMLGFWNIHNRRDACLGNEKTVGLAGRMIVIYEIQHQPRGCSDSDRREEKLHSESAPCHTRTCSILVSPRMLLDGYNAFSRILYRDCGLPPCSLSRVFDLVMTHGTFLSKQRTVNLLNCGGSKQAAARRVRESVERQISPHRVPRRNFNP